MGCKRKDSLVSTWDHHFAHDDLLCAKDDTVLATNSNSCATHTWLTKFSESGIIMLLFTNRDTYLEVSTAFSAYSTWKILPSGESEEHS